MGYQFEVDPHALIDARTPQWVGTGLSAADIAGVRAAVRDMWSDGPGGWVPEWSRLAGRLADGGDHLRAAAAYGVARFPCLADAPRRAAFDRQLEHYRLAAPRFPVRFARHVVPVDHVGGRLDVPVHVLSSPDAGPAAPVLLASGGVDTWKMDQHPIFAAVATGIHGHVVGFDHPGTGELTAAPLDASSHEVVRGLVPFARSLTGGRVGHLGISFGGYFSACSGLRGDVDAAIVLGGPVSRSFAAAHLATLGHGMRDIIANALGCVRRPEPGEFAARMSALDLAPLLANGGGSPMLVINGDADPMVRRGDVTLFEERAHTEVVLVPGAGHCATDRIGDVLTTIIEWAAKSLAG